MIVGPGVQASLVFLVVLLSSVTVGLLAQDLDEAVTVAGASTGRSSPVVATVADDAATGGASEDGPQQDQEQGREPPDYPHQR